TTVPGSVGAAALPPLGVVVLIRTAALRIQSVPTRSPAVPDSEEHHRADGRHVDHLDVLAIEAASLVRACEYAVRLRRWRRDRRGILQVFVRARKKVRRGQADDRILERRNL